MNLFTINTNFDALLLIFIFITAVGALSPVSQYFRNVLVNFLFMGALLFSIMKFGLDLTLYINMESILAFSDSLIQIGLIFGLTAVFLRFRGDESLYDTLFLGFGPYLVMFMGVIIGIGGDKYSDVSFIFTGLLIFFYALFILKKLSISMFFSIKRIGDTC